MGQGCPPDRLTAAVVREVREERAHARRVAGGRADGHRPRRRGGDPSGVRRRHGRTPPARRPRQGAAAVHACALAARGDRRPYPRRPVVTRHRATPHRPRRHPASRTPRRTRQRTPQRTAIVHRAIRVTTASCAGFYLFVYGVDRPETALYALFGPVALGILSPIPGSGRQRAAVILRALPVGLVLVTLGTVLAVHTWAAVLGMLVVGFALTFAAVAGPRPAGAAPGLQLFYILACFPPYAPDTLGARLAGLTLGVLLLAACEVYLLPTPPTATYRQSLADAVTIAGRAAAAAASGDRSAEGADDSADRLRETGRQLRLSRLPPAERPAGAGRADRALAQAGAAARRLLDQLAHLRHTPPTVSVVATATSGRGANADADATGQDTKAEADATGQGTKADAGAETDADAPSADLLGRVAALCEAIATALRTGRPPPRSGPPVLDAAMRDFQGLRITQATGPPQSVPPAPVLRRQSSVLALTESARILQTAVRVGLDGRRRPPIPPRELFWYADTPTYLLWWRRLTGHMTLRSVLFQNAVRTALGLGAARLVAGSLDLSHGFWVLLAVLTLGRPTAGGTWTAVRSALAGTLAGALATGTLLLVVGRHTDAYAAVLVPAMLAAFALGPLLGIAWAQALFTLVVSAAFAQIAPASWQLAEDRIVDVATGSAIGLLCGLLAWPAGARREVRRTMAALLRSCGPLITGTVEVLLATPPGTAPLPPTRPVLHRLRLAEAAYLQYRSEPGDRSEVSMDWHAVLITANHILLGAHWLPRFDLPERTVTPEATALARTAAGHLVLATDRVAAICAGEGPPPQPPAVPAYRSPTEVRGLSPLPALIDLEHWLNSLTAQLARIESSVPPGR
ncbi:FUSC family protein [Streptomyces lunaelactis]|nr:FUSC family protein [Streptomyces lunaelactis]